MNLSLPLRIYLIATSAFTGAIIMIVEILGAKMLAPYIGTSHFVWTAQIGVTLMALAIGYAIGGRMADKAKSPAPMYLALVIAALFLTISVLACEFVALACVRINLELGSLLASAFLFFIPLCLMAMVPPFLIRSLTASISKVGSNAGFLSAVSTVGSVIGTTMIGYMLIPFFANTHIMLTTAFILALLGLVYFIVWQRKQVKISVAVLLLIGIGTALGIVKPDDATPPHMVEIHRSNSNFGLMQVVDNPRNQMRYYLNDFLTQNIYHPKSKQSAALFTHMLYGLSYCYTEEIKDVLCIGMGVGIVPMQFANDGATVDVVEINPTVVPLAVKYFDFQPEKCNLTIADGRTFVTTTEKRYNTIILDAFLGESSPSHLMTKEALDGMRKLLKPGGSLVINAFGSFQQGKNFFSGSLQKTLEAVFPSVHLHAIGDGNLFYVASTKENANFVRRPILEIIPFPLRARASAYFASRVSAAAGNEKAMVLTDNYNPVDYYDAANREELRRQLALSTLN